jgi:hypothetical protein
MPYKIRICDPAEYRGNVLIETDYYENWAVAPWDEWGIPELCGPFPSVEAARANLDEHRDYLEWRGLRIQSCASVS